MNYEKQEFKNGQVLTAECLNRMEDGIKGACEAAPPTCDSADCSKVLSYGANGFEWIDKPNVVDDENISTETTWSSQNIVDKLCPSFNESGAMVACKPLEGLPLEVVSHIVPKQAGSGDPSLTNIRPITGYDSVKLSRTGKNLLAYPYQETTNTNYGMSWLDNGDGSITLNGTTTVDWLTFCFHTGENLKKIRFVPGATYIFNAPPTGLSFVVAYKDETGKEHYVAPGQVIAWGDGYELTLCYLQINYAGTTFNNVTFYPQIELGTVATPFEPYKGDTFTIDIGQTVYGGKFNWQTGELTIDRETLVFDGGNIHFDWFGYTNGNAFGFRRIKPSATWESLCSHLKAKFTQTYGDIIITDVNVDGLMAYDQHFTSEQEANAWLAEQYANGTPFTVCYELRNPITIQLTPQEILALSGTNVLSSSTGDTDVSGKADPTAVIQDIYAKLNAVMATTAALTGV